jgi:hypothetical protein
VLSKPNQQFLRDLTPMNSGLLGEKTLALDMEEAGVCNVTLPALYVSCFWLCQLGTASVSEKISVPPRSGTPVGPLDPRRARALCPGFLLPPPQAARTAAALSPTKRRRLNTRRDDGIADMAAR